MGGGSEEGARTLGKTGGRERSWSGPLNSTVRLILAPEPLKGEGSSYTATGGVKKRIWGGGKRSTKSGVGKNSNRELSRGVRSSI